MRAKSHSSEEETVVQAAKGAVHDSSRVKNKQEEGTGDLTAYGKPGNSKDPKRGRSCHSSQKAKDSSLMRHSELTKFQSLRLQNQRKLCRVVSKQLGMYQIHGSFQVESRMMRKYHVRFGKQLHCALTSPYAGCRLCLHRGTLLKNRYLVSRIS